MNIRNELNDLAGNEWLYWTDTLYLTHFPPDSTHHLRKMHGAIKPPQLMADIIRFFTKRDQLILDPFAGVGSTLLGAALCGRKAVGFEINETWVRIYQKICRNYVVAEKGLAPRDMPGSQECGPIDCPMLNGDCLQLFGLFQDESVDAVITDPPYGCHHGCKGFRGETNFNMKNDQPGDLGNAADFEIYLKNMEKVGREVRRLLKPGRYFVLLVGDRYFHGEYVPLGMQTAVRLQAAGFKLKGIKIWSNRATVRPLRPYGIYRCFVPNITHQNIIILQKGV